MFIIVLFCILNDMFTLQGTVISYHISKVQIGNHFSDSIKKSRKHNPVEQTPCFLLHRLSFFPKQLPSVFKDHQQFCKKIFIYNKNNKLFLEKGSCLSRSAFMAVLHFTEVLREGHTAREHQWVTDFKQYTSE